MQRLILVIEVDEIPSTVFREWPLHCTLVHWFDYEGNLESLQQKLQAQYDGKTPVELIAQQEAGFGVNHDVAVNTLAKTKELMDLHEESVKCLEGMDAQFTAAHYLLSGYQPHVTHHKGKKLAEGQSHKSQTICLVMSVNEQPKERKLIARFKLGK